MVKKNNTLMYGAISLAVLIVAVIGIGFYGGNAETSEMEDVTVMMPFIASPFWAPFYSAIDQGYYADEGLKVTIQYTGEGSMGPIKQVGAGKVDFGYTHGDAIITSRLKDIPVVAVYQVDHADVFNIITKKESGITKPADLVGKKIAIAGAGTSPYIAAMAMLYKAGVDYNDVEFVPVGAALLPGFVAGELDATAATIPQEVILEKVMHVEYNAMRAKDHGANFATFSIITSEKTLKNNPDLIRKFLRATDKGLKYAINNPEEAINIYIKFNPDAEKQRAVALSIWERNINEAILPDKYPLGEFDRDQWIYTQDTMYEIGVIDKKTDVSKMYTDEFVPK